MATIKIKGMTCNHCVMAVTKASARETVSDLKEMGLRVAMSSVSVVSMRFACASFGLPEAVMLYSF